MFESLNTIVGIISGLRAILVFLFEISNIRDLKEKLSACFSRTKNITNINTHRIDLPDYTSDDKTTDKNNQDSHNLVLGI